ncbi:MAG: fibronectin type III domain-containing protein [Candidatus Thermoplasmatota archaeon]|nr:fibronectin type III domain-containing protein [Candidatus Thermoplasmatota archaeon]
MDLSSMTLLYSTYLGGTDMDYPSSIVVANGYAYIGGTTYSNDFNVTSGAYLTSNSGGSTGFILKFDMKQRSLVYCTYFGGSGDDKLNDIAVDVQGNVYACGNTGSIDLPVPFTALGTTLNGTSDGFVMCLDPKGSALLFSSFIGGSGEEVLNALFVDPDSNIHLIGYEKDPDEDGFDFPTMAGVVQEQARGGEEEVVYVKLDSNASHYLYSTFLGGNGDDKGLDIFVDPSSGEPVILGYTSSSNFPVKPGSFDTSYTFYEIFVTKFVLTFPPSKPRNLESRSGDSFVELRWDPPSDDGGAPIIKYSVWRGSQGGNLSMRLDNVTCLTYNDTSVENGHVYYYGVRALNRAWEGPFSDEVSSYPVSIPTSPRNLRVTSWGDEVLELSWMYPNYTGGEGIPIRGYNLYRIAAGEPEPLKISIDGSLLHYSDENVMNGVNYSYRATAFNDHGESPPSDPVHAVPMTIPTGVTDPYVLCGSRFAHLFWGPPDDDGGSPILDYMILREEGLDKKLITLDGNHTEYNDTSLVNGKSYNYTIKARNVVGFGPLSDFATCEPMGRPSSPRSVILEVHPGSITLSWFPPSDNGGSDIEEYLIYRSMDGSEWTMIMSVPFTDLSYTDKCLINGKTYHYTITVKNHFQESEPSIALNGTPLDVPGMPPMLTLTAGDGYVLLNWETSTIDGGTPILGFWILRGKNESSMVSMIEVGANVLMFNDTTVENGKEYLYQVKAFNAFGMGRGTGFISAIPAGLPSPPVIVVVTSGDRFVEIEWSEPLVNGGFPINTVRIYKWTENSSASVILRTDDVQGSFKDISVENGITYMYAMSCENDIGEGSRSCVLNATPLGQPSAPTRLSINPLSPTSVEISWGSPQDTGGSPIVSYHIYRSEDSESWRKIAFISGDELNYTDPNLDSGRVYWYRVSAENAQGEGPHGEEISIELKESGGFSGMYLLIAGAVLFLIILGSALGLAILRRKKGSFESPAPGEVEASPCDMDT